MNTSPKTWQTISAVIFFVGIIGLASFLLSSDNVTGAIAKAGYWAPIFLILLKISTIVISPLGGTPIYFAVPALFGFWPGFIYLVIADTLGYLAVFWISRTYGRKLMNRMLSEDQLAWADKMLKHMGHWKGLTIIRVIFAPFSDTISYAAGLTKISLKEYFWATFPLLVVHVAITNNIASHFVKDSSTYLIVVGAMVSISVLYILFRKKLKKLFLQAEK